MQRKSVTYANTASKAPKETFNKVDKKDRNATDVVYEIGEERLNVGKTKNYVSSGGEVLNAITVRLIYLKA